MWLMQNALAKPDNAGAGADRLHASLRPGRARLDVGRMAKAPRMQAGERRPAMPSCTTTSWSPARFFMERDACPETAAASRPHLRRRREHDGAAGGSVLIADAAADAKLSIVVRTTGSSRGRSRPASRPPGRPTTSPCSTTGAALPRERRSRRSYDEFEKRRDVRPRGLDQGRRGRAALRGDARGIWRRRRQLRA